MTSLRRAINQKCWDCIHDPQSGGRQQVIDSLATKRPAVVGAVHG